MTLTKAPAESALIPSSIPGETVIIPSIADAADYTLTSLVIQNDVAVNDLGGNIILYSLHNAAGDPISGSYLTFSASSNVTFIPAYGTTNADGQFVLHVTSVLSGKVLITASSTTTPQVSNHTEINFTAIQLNYTLITNVTTNNVSANGIATNTIQATLINLATGQGVSGQTLLITTNGQANYPAQVITDVYGNANIALSSYQPGNLTVIIRLQNNTAYYAIEVVRFV